jgi:hypothetical protein
VKRLRRAVTAFSVVICSVKELAVNHTMTLELRMNVRRVNSVLLLDADFLVMKKQCAFGG